MIMAAGESGCNPLATGIMSDIFPESKVSLQIDNMKKITKKIYVDQAGKKFQL